MARKCCTVTESKWQVKCVSFDELGQQLILTKHLIHCFHLVEFLIIRNLLGKALYSVRHTKPKERCFTVFRLCSFWLCKQRQIRLSNGWESVNQQFFTAGARDHYKACNWMRYKRWFGRLLYKHGVCLVAQLYAWGVAVQFPGAAKYLFSELSRVAPGSIQPCIQSVLGAFLGQSGLRH